MTLRERIADRLRFYPGFRAASYIALGSESFYLAVDRHRGKVAMIRVIAVRVGDAADGTPTMTAMTTDGDALPVAPDGSGHIVKGADHAPSGAEWREIYRLAVPSNDLVRDVTTACRSLLA